MTGFRWIPWAIAASFVPVLGINGLLVQQALHSNTGLVSDHAFDTGQDYNRVIAAGRKQQALGWKAEIALTRNAGEARARITVRVRDAAGAALRGLELGGRLYSPVDPQPDQSLSLAEGEDGVYRQDIDLPRSGQWDAQLVARQGEDSFAIDQRLILR
jgi:nitrogen fixation protein FixH